MVFLVVMLQYVAEGCCGLPVEESLRLNPETDLGLGYMIRGKEQVRVFRNALVSEFATQTGTTGKSRPLRTGEWGLLGLKRTHQSPDVFQNWGRVSKGCKRTSFNGLGKVRWAPFFTSKERRNRQGCCSTES